MYFLLIFVIFLLINRELLLTDELKIQAFEYLVSKFLEWYEETSSKENEGNDLSILKVLKLTFFASAVGTNSNSENTLLDNVFGNYVAMPYGHVESDIYSFIKSKRLIYININNRKTYLDENDISKIGKLDSFIKKLVDSAVSLLKSINKDLIKLSSFELVELSHTWYSWQQYYSIALDNNRNSEPIPNEVIKGEDKIYQL